MSTAYGQPCPKCDRAPLLRFGTVNGRLVEEVVQSCPCERRRRRICRDCPASIAHRSYQALLCERCAEKSRAAMWTAGRARRLDSIRERDAKRARAKRAEDREAYRQKRRERYYRERERLLAQRKAGRRWNNPAYQRTLANNRASAKRRKEAAQQAVAAQASPPEKHPLEQAA